MERDGEGGRLAAQKPVNDHPVLLLHFSSLLHTITSGNHRVIFRCSVLADLRHMPHYTG